MARWGDTLSAIHAQEGRTASAQRIEGLRGRWGRRIQLQGRLWDAICVAGHRVGPTSPVSDVWCVLQRVEQYAHGVAEPGHPPRAKGAPVRRRRARSDLPAGFGQYGVADVLVGRRWCALDQSPVDQPVDEFGEPAAGEGDLTRIGQYEWSTRW